MQRNPQRLAARGPIDADNGFPRWYKDAAGRRLEPAFDPRDPNTPAMGDLPDPLAPVSFPGNFPDEAFYFLAEAELPVGGQAQPGRARLVLALEAAFATEVVAAGQQQVFARVRVRLDGGIPGAAYTFTHPYGQTDPLVADESGRVFVTEDIGAGAGQFDVAVADGEVAPFLSWGAGAPAGYLGDGVTEHTITGSPLGFDFFRVEGPGVGGLGNPDPADPTNPDKIFTDLFTVQGRINTRVGADVTRAVYTRRAGVVVLDIFATSEPGQTLRAAGTTLTGDGGTYHARAAAVDVPVAVEVVNATDQPPTIAGALVTDAVTVLVADYDTAQRQLTVEAVSSDLDDVPPLTVTGLGPLTDGKQIFADVAAPPAFVEVVSAHGGSARRHVLVSGPPGPGDPVTAFAGPDRLAAAGDLVTLDAAASSGAGLSFRWEQTSGTPVALANANLSRATFTAPAAGALEFRLTVQGPGGTAVDTVSIQITPTGPGGDTLTVTQAEFRTASGRWRIRGTATAALPDVVVAALGDTEIGSAPVDALHEWDIRRTVIPGEPGITPAAGAVLTLTSSRGGSTTVPVTIRN